MNPGRPGLIPLQAASLTHRRTGPTAAGFACLCLPPLEAGLRTMFVEANPSEAALGFAHLNRYFSTLDGYGQRSKHQLLLEKTLLSNGEPNRLVDVLRHCITACHLN